MIAGALNKLGLKVYYALPPFLKNCVASGNGYWLNRWRYGSHYKCMLPVVAEREKWSADQWREYQANSLKLLLQRAVDSVPYYRDLHRKGMYPVEDVHVIEDLHILPMLEKEALRNNPLDFLADDCIPNRMYHEHTSGTSGKPLKLFWSHLTHQENFALFEQRVRRWNGVKWGDCWALLGGQLIVPHERTKPPFWVWNYPARQLYMSVYHLAHQFLDSYLDQILSRRVTYIMGYPSALDALAVHALERKRTDIRLKTAIGIAEPFLSYQRDRVAVAFSCITREAYGNAELVCAATECPHGSLHQEPEMGIVEIVDKSGKTVDMGVEGEMVCTGLLNRDHILIRYRIGDSASLAPSNRKCPCGIDMPIFDKICGRSDDLAVTSDGRLIGRLARVFTDTKIKEAQIVQVDMDRFVVRCVPGKGFGKADKNLITQRMAERLGKVNVKIEIVDSIPRDNSGKFKAVKNEMQRDAPIS